MNTIRILSHLSGQGIPIDSLTVGPFLEKDHAVVSGSVNQGRVKKFVSMLVWEKGTEDFGHLEITSSLEEPVSVVKTTTVSINPYIKRGNEKVNWLSIRTSDKKKIFFDLEKHVVVEPPQSN